MKVSKHGDIFEITGITDAAEAVRFLRQNGFKILNDGQTRVVEQRNAPVHAEQNGALCDCRYFWPDEDTNDATCRVCGKPPRSNRSEGGFYAFERSQNVT